MRWTQEGGLVVPRGDKEATSGKVGRSLMGGKEEESTVGYILVVGSRVRWRCRYVSHNDEKETGYAQVGK